MLKIKVIIIMLALLLISSVYAVTPNPGHDASSVGSGTFAAGDFTFQNTVYATLFSGLFNWIITPGMSMSYLFFNQTSLSFNETYMNATIRALVPTSLPAANITAGTFNSGSFVFANNLNVTGNLTVHNKIYYNSTSVYRSYNGTHLCDVVGNTKVCIVGS
jgi:hypothetical protein